MSDAPETIDTELPVTDAAAAPVEGAEAPEAAAPDLDAEDRAMAMGWTPKGQFKGDPAKWVDAETFVKRGEEFLPFLKANNRRLEDALKRSETKLGKLEKTLETFADHHSKTEARMFERAVKEVQSRLDAAAESGDVQAVRDATDELVALNNDAATPAPKVTPEPEGEPEQLTDWKAENPWFGRDAAMRGAAIEIVNELIAEGVNDLGKQLKEVDKRIRADFPHKFKNPRREEPGAVEGGVGAPRVGGKTYADLPADAKKMCDEFVRDIKGFTREKYIRDYFA